MRAARLVAVGLLLMAGVVIASPPGRARACSCAESSATDLAAGTDVGFIGSLVAVEADGERGVYRFDVEWWLNGDLDAPTVEVDSSLSGASCGFEVPIGGRVAVFADRRDDRLEGGLCSTLSADSVLAALDPTPLPGGTAVVAVTGDFAGGRFALLDEGGRLVGYRGERAEDPGPPRAVACADDRHVVLLGFPDVDVVDLATLDVVASVDTAGLQQSASIVDLRCTGGGTDEVRLLVESADGQTADVRRLSTWSTPGEPIARKPAARLVLTATNVFATEPQDPGDLLVMIGPDGVRTVLAEIERPADSNFAGYDSVVSSPDGRLVALSEVTYHSGGVEGRVAILDAAAGDELVAVDTEVGLSVVGWLGHDRIITVVTDGGPPALQIRDATTLLVERDLPSWPAFRAAATGTAVWGVIGGTVHRVDGAVRTVAVLPSEATGDVLALVNPIDVPPGTAIEPILVPRAPRSPTAAEQSARADVVAGSGGSSTGVAWWSATFGAIAALVVVGGLVVVQSRRDLAQTR